MQTVPVVKCSDLSRSIRFYTEVLDFERKWPQYADSETANGVAHLVKAGAELQLSRHAGDGVFGSLQRVFVDDVDERYRTFRSRGLDTTRRPESPIHTAPVDQTWGLREFSVTDPDGNGLCFCTPITDRVGVAPAVNVKQAVPFFGVVNMEASLRFYIDGLGFTMSRYWIPDGDGHYPSESKVRWCWLELGDAAIMLQEFSPSRRPKEVLGIGASVCFQCHDALALYREFKGRGITTRQTPFVGNHLWVVALTDPDGYHIDFESPTEAPEESELEEQE